MSTAQAQAASFSTREAHEDDNYKRLSSDMHKGLKDIYKQINTVSSGELANRKKADLLFSEAAEQLSEVLDSTQKATESIMEKVEQHMDMNAEIFDILRAARRGELTEEKLDSLEAMLSQMNEDLSIVMTTLSFQDLTGQRIKKVVNALQQIEHTVVDLYLASGLIMKGLEDCPDKDMEEIKKEAHDTVRDLKEGKRVQSELKGPSKNASSQADIDDLLAQLGM